MEVPRPTGLARSQTAPSRRRRATLTAMRRPPRPSSAANSERPRLLDHLVRRGQQRFRDGEAERLGGLEVDDKLDFYHLLHRQIARELYQSLSVIYSDGVPPG